MVSSKRVSTATLAVVLILMTLAGEGLAQLKVGFYAKKCGDNNVERIIFNVIKDIYNSDPTIVAVLVRLQFHDCFVRGCDASVLLDGPNTEKTARINVGLKGFELIDVVKAAVERACPGLVSCADVIAIATRVSIFLAKGKWYDVETGRRDGIFSFANDADSDLPGPGIPVPQAVQRFASKGIGKEDFVLLLGGHTVGVANCFFIEDRLYNFRGTPGKTDPTLNPDLARTLKQTCPRGGRNFVPLDQSSPNAALTIGNGYFKAIRMFKGILQIDQDLALDPSTAALVTKYAFNNDLFNDKFGDAMVKLGRIGVLTGNQGQIRKSCRFAN